MKNDDVLSRGEGRGFSAGFGTAGEDAGNPNDSAEPFRAVTISATDDDRIYIGRFCPTDPKWTYWNALDAACEYLDVKYPGWQRIAASREFYPSFVKLEFVIGGL